MLRNYNGAAQQCAPEQKTTKSRAPQEQDALTELRRRFAQTLMDCYDLCESGRRCRFEDNLDKAYDCARCPFNDSSHFCRRNLVLRKLIVLVAEYLAERMIASASQAPWLDPQMMSQFLTREAAAMTDDEREAFEERIAVCVHDGGLPEVDAALVAMDAHVRRRR